MNQIYTKVKQLQWSQYESIIQEGEKYMTIK